MSVEELKSRGEYLKDDFDPNLLNVDQMRGLCKYHKVPGFYKLLRAELVANFKGLIKVAVAKEAIDQAQPLSSISGTVRSSARLRRQPSSAVSC